MFIAGLFTIGRTWKQPRMSISRRMDKKAVDTQLLKKNAFESVLVRWMKLELIIQSKVRKKNTNTVY